MSSISLGDLAQSFSLQRRSVSLRNDLNRLTDELSSGQVSDIREILAGNHSYLTDLERSLNVLEGYSVTTVEAGQLTGAMQSTLDRVQGIGGQLALDLIGAGMGPVAATAGDPSQSARIQLQGIIASINDDVAGRSLFAGAATDQTALRDADQLLTDLTAVVSAFTTPDDMLAAAKTWFDDPAGFDAAMYTGSSTSLAPFQLSQTERVTLDVRANDPAIKDLLMNTAMAALTNDPALGLSVTDQIDMFGKTGIGLQSGQDKMTELRARIGFAQERIDMIETRNGSEKTSLEFALGNLLQADPFQAATELESVQFQLQALYSVTVRSSQLSLVKFL